MSNIKFAVQPQKILKEIYENYRLGYIGDNFSNAFLNWNTSLVNSFNSIGPSSTPITITTPIGDISYYSVFINGELFQLIERIDLDGAVLSRVEASSMAQNVASRVTRKSAIASVAPNRYVFARDGGTLNGIPVEIVKRNISRTRKPVYVENYRVTDTTGVRILSQYDLKSANRFENNQAIGWGVDGKQYLFDSSYLNENRKRKTIISESQLCQIIREVIKKIIA